MLCCSDRETRPIRRRRLDRAFLGILASTLALSGDMVAGYQRIVRDEFVRVSIMPESLGASYQNGLDPSILYWTYSSEPLVLQLTVWNNTSDVLDIRRDPRDWFQAATLEIQPDAVGQRSDAGTRSPLSARLLGRQETAGILVEPSNMRLAPGAYQQARMQVDPAVVRSLKPGTYVIRASVDSGHFPAWVRDRRSRLVDEVRIGVRNVESRTDQLNLYAHLATWARINGNIAEARQWVNELLSINPASAVAYAQRGQIARMERNCVRATQNWQRAIDLMLSDADPEDATRGKIARTDAIENLREQIRLCR